MYTLNGVSSFGQVLRTSTVFIPAQISLHQFGRTLSKTALLTLHLPAVQVAFELFELFEHDLLYLFRLADDLNELRQHDVNIRDFFPDALVGDLDLRTVAVVEGYGPLEIADRLREL